MRVADLYDAAIVLTNPAGETAGAVAIPSSAASSCLLLRIACKSNPAAPPATKQPDGQITKSLSSPSMKNIPLSPSGKSLI
jgi:hypothetical protein